MDRSPRSMLQHCRHSWLFENDRNTVENNILDEPPLTAGTIPSKITERAISIVNKLNTGIHSCQERTQAFLQRIATQKQQDYLSG